MANSGVKIQQVEGVSQPDFKDYDTMMFTDTISQIGSDWKSYDFTAGWVVNDNTVYFVQDTTSADKAVWKIYFTGFGGMGTGMYSFIKEKMNATSVNDISERSLVVYPNPASNQINVIHDFKGDAEFTVYNLAGQPVIKTKNVEGSGLNKQNMDISALPIGMYSLQVRSGNDIKTVKFIKR